MPFLASERCFWPLPAFMRLEVKKNCAHVLPYTILNKSYEINLSIGCMVWPTTLLWVRQDILGLLMRLGCFCQLKLSDRNDVVIAETYILWSLMVAVGRDLIATIWGEVPRRKMYIVLLFIISCQNNVLSAILHIQILNACIVKLKLGKNNWL